MSYIEDLVAAYRILAEHEVIDARGRESVHERFILVPVSMSAPAR